METKTLVIILVLALLTILICQVLLHRQKHQPSPSIRIVLDSEDSAAFRAVMQVLIPKYIEGATYDDNGNVTIIELIVPKHYKKHIFSKLSEIKNIEVAEVS